MLGNIKTDNLYFTIDIYLLVNMSIFIITLTSSTFSMHTLTLLLTVGRKIGVSNLDPGSQIY